MLIFCMFSSLDDLYQHLSVLTAPAIVVHLSITWIGWCCMSADRLVQARHHNSRHALADVFFVSALRKVTRQHCRVKLLSRQGVKFLSTSKRQTHATLHTTSNGEATEMCKLLLQQQLVGANRGIFGVKVRRPHAHGLMHLWGM